MCGLLSKPKIAKNPTPAQPAPAPTEASPEVVNAQEEERRRRQQQGRETYIGQALAPKAEATTMRKTLMGG